MELLSYWESQHNRGDMQVSSYCLGSYYPFGLGTAYLLVEKLLDPSTPSATRDWITYTFARQPMTLNGHFIDRTAKRRKSLLTSMLPEDRPEINLNVEVTIAMFNRILAAHPSLSEGTVSDLVAQLSDKDDRMASNALEVLSNNPHVHSRNDILIAMASLLDNDDNS